MHIVTLRQLSSATCDVGFELGRLGFYNEAVQAVDVYLVSVGLAYGWHWYGGSGEIHVPRFSWSRISHIFRGGYTSLRDVLRHEYAHAVADNHRGLIGSPRFGEAFGASHSWDFSWEYDPDHHISPYAATAPAEDFAETFMVYLRHGGRLPARYDTPLIRRKWTFIRDLGNALTQGRRRW